MSDDVAVGGRFDRSIADFIRACKARLAELQRDPRTDSALIAVLCDAVRLAREYCEVMQGVGPRPEVENLITKCRVVIEAVRAVGAVGHWDAPHWTLRVPQREINALFDLAYELDPQLSAALRAVGVPAGEKKETK